MPVSAGMSHFPAWPVLADYQAILESTGKPVLTASGIPIRFIPQRPKPAQFSEKYEPRIFLTGEVQTRTANWHDLFNALVWLSFPKSKAVINARHYAAFQQREEKATASANRQAVQDAITLLDESGVIIACADENLAQLLKTHQWKDLFWHRRDQTRAGMKFILFGHSLYEKALNPYIGITGKGLILTVDKRFFTQSITDQLVALDNQLAAYLSNPHTLTSTKILCAVPLLGIPGWTLDNESENYYNNTAYFRPEKHAANTLASA